MSLQDQNAYVNAKRLLEPTGVTLEAACRDYAEAFKLLGGVPLLAAAREYGTRHDTKVAPKLIQEVVNEFMAAKEAGRSTRLRGNGRNVSDKYLYQLRLKLNDFAGSVKGLIANVTAEAINNYVHNMKQTSGRTKNNYIQAINVLFEFARKQRYVPRDFAVIDEVEVAAEEDFEIEIFSPKELKLLLAHCPEPLVPVLVIGAFAGLRTAEIDRLDWSEVSVKSGHIEVKAKKAKTRARRLVPIVPALAAWLESFRMGAIQAGKIAEDQPLQGPVWEQSLPYLFELQREMAKAAGIAWKHNALRHSFISYRVADIKNVDQTALEAGNSPDIIFQHYRELVTMETAKEWFAVMPAAVEAEGESLRAEGAKLRAAKVLEVDRQAAAKAAKRQRAKKHSRRAGLSLAVPAALPAELAAAV